MRRAGFEPADPYGTEPSTLRRWPGLATYARKKIASSLLKVLSFDSYRGICLLAPSFFCPIVHILLV